MLAPKPPTVVIVDDDDAVRSALKFALELEGYDVRTFASGEALLSCHDLPAKGCFVLDFRLPRLNALRLLDAVRRRGITWPAVLITSNPTPALRLEAEDLGIPILEKPLMCDGLIDQLHQMMAHA